jgi:hypothetical protein
MIQADTVGRMREHLAWSGLGHQVLVRFQISAMRPGPRCALLVRKDDKETAVRHASLMRLGFGAFICAESPPVGRSPSVDINFVAEAGR